jgi:hypothetical protein
MKITSGGFFPADFIRANLLKHGLVRRAVDWRRSSFQRTVFRCIVKNDLYDEGMISWSHIVGYAKRTRLLREERSQ